MVSKKNILKKSRYKPPLRKAYLEVSHSYPITHEDRISYCYRYILKGNKRIIVAIVHVSYDYLFNDEWITIVHYDSIHKPWMLHQHELNNLEQKTYYDFLIPEVKIVEGKMNEWFTTIQDHLKECYEDYKNRVTYLRT